MILLSVNSLAYGQTTPNIPQTPNILPDSPFYVAKLTFENIRTVLTFNDTEKAQYEVDLAQERLSEIKAELQKGDLADAQKAQNIHDNEVNEVESIADKQNTDNHGFAVKTFVHQLLADHDKNIGDLVSQFTNNGTSSIVTTPMNNTGIGIMQNLQSSTEKIRQYHGDAQAINPNVKASNREH